MLEGVGAKHLEAKDIEQRDAPGAATATAIANADAAAAARGRVDSRREPGVDGGDDGINGATAGRKGANKSETDSQTLLTNLESETQKVSQAILKLQVSVERLHAVIGDDGDRTCASALQDIIALMAQGQSGPAAATVASNETNGSPVGRGGRKSKYGLVPEETNHLR